MPKTKNKEKEKTDGSRRKRAIYSKDRGKRLQEYIENIQKDSTYGNRSNPLSPNDSFLDNPSLIVPPIAIPIPSYFNGDIASINSLDPHNSNVNIPPISLPDINNLNFLSLSSSDTDNTMDQLNTLAGEGIPIDSPDEYCIVQRQMLEKLHLEVFQRKEESEKLTKQNSQLQQSLNLAKYNFNLVSAQFSCLWEEMSILKAKQSLDSELAAPTFNVHLLEDMYEEIKSLTSKLYYKEEETRSLKALLAEARKALDRALDTNNQNNENLSSDHLTHFFIPAESVSKHKRLPSKTLDSDDECVGGVSYDQLPEIPPGSAPSSYEKLPHATLRSTETDQLSEGVNRLEIASILPTQFMK